MYIVHLCGHDLWRLMRGLDLPWTAIAELAPLYPSPPPICFRLDRGPPRHCFTLRRKPSGPCHFLLELHGGLRRCGVHALRPWACRAYPLEVGRDAPDGALVFHAACPTNGLQKYVAALPELRPVLHDDRGEWLLYREVLRRWDQLAERVPEERPLTPDLFVEWTNRLYDGLEPLRRPERGEWQLDAYRFVAEFPLPG
jgi:Fe-S-cluster containining protein